MSYLLFYVLSVVVVGWLYFKLELPRQHLSLGRGLIYVGMLFINAILVGGVLAGMAWLTDISSNKFYLGILWYVGTSYTVLIYAYQRQIARYSYRYNLKFILMIAPLTIFTIITWAVG